METSMEVDSEVERRISEGALANAPCGGRDGDHDAVEAEDTVEGTVAKRRTVEYGMGAAIDVDNAEWNREYVERGNRNLERLKELGLYRRLQEMGIVYDAKQFRRAYSIGAAAADGRQVQMPSTAGLSVYDDAEAQFDKATETGVK